MNLNDFERTNYSGLYISKDSHPEFGNKYIAEISVIKKICKSFRLYKKR